MAIDTDSVGFFAAEVLQRTAERQPQKTAIITKEEELTFGALNQRVHALAGRLQQEGIRQGDRVGVLLPNSTAIPLSYFATQKIGAVTVILDARLKGKELKACSKTPISNCSWCTSSSMARCEKRSKLWRRFPSGSSLVTVNEALKSAWRRQRAR